MDKAIIVAVYLAVIAVAAQVTASPLFDDNSVIDVELTGPTGSLVDGEGRWR